MSDVRSSHGDGRFEPLQFKRIGTGVVIEPGVLVFHPESIEIGENVYIGHNTILKGYHKGFMRISDGAWIGQQCFLHSAGGITIGRNVGIGPAVKIITSEHAEPEPGKPIMSAPLKFSEVVIGDGSDIGTAAIILPGTRLGRLVRVGAGAVVKGTFPDGSVIAGVPARIIE